MARYKPPTSRKQSAVTPSKRWRDVIKVHPAADLFPMMTADELMTLGEDIKKNGLMSPIAITASKKVGGYWEYQLLDGRNRLDALEAVGLPVTISLSDGQCRIATKATANVPEFDTYNGAKVTVVDDDPYAYVVSANIHRRRLTIEQKDDLIASVLKAQPSKSNRQVAKVVGVSHPHVAAVRTKLEKSGDVETVTTSIDTKGRKQPVRKPAAKKRRDIDDYLDEKKARLASAKTNKLFPASEIVKPIDTIMSTDTTETTDTATTTDTEPVNINKSPNAIALKVHVFNLVVELLVLDGDYSECLTGWRKACPDYQFRSELASALKDVSRQITAMVQEIEDRNPASNGDVLDIPTFLDRRRS